MHDLNMYVIRYVGQENGTNVEEYVLYILSPIGPFNPAEVQSLNFSKSKTLNFRKIEM